MEQNQETPEFLAVAQILRSKRRAAAFLKGMKGVEFPKLIEAAKEYRREVQAAQANARLSTVGPDPETRDLLFVMRTMALTSFPHSPYEKPVLTREVRLGPNAWIKVMQTARKFDEGIQLPFGVNARRVFILLCTLAVENQSDFISLDSALEFMRRLGWGLTTQGSRTLSKNRYDALSYMLKAFQGVTLDLDYVGVFPSRSDPVEAMQIIKKYNLPKKNDDGKRGLFPVDETTEEIGPPGSFWIKLDGDFYKELVGNPARGTTGNVFPFKADYLLNFTTSKEMDIALFLASRCSAAETVSRPISLHDIWNQLGIDPSNYSVFKRTFTDTLEHVRKVWDGCRAYVPESSHTLIIEPVPAGKELVPRSLADTILQDFLTTRTSPDARAKQYIEMAKDAGQPRE